MNKRGSALINHSIHPHQSLHPQLRALVAGGTSGCPWPSQTPNVVPPASFIALIAQPIIHSALGFPDYLLGLVLLATLPLLILIAAIVPLPCLLLLIVVGSTNGSETQLVEEVEFGNVTFVKSIHFGDNTSLAEDVTVLDSLFKLRRSVVNPNDTVPEREARHSKRSESVKMIPLVRLLMVGDHSMYEHFLALHSGDEYSAYNGLKSYLDGLYEQLETIFDTIWLFNETTRLHLQLTASLPIRRPEDCPLRGGLYYPIESNSTTANNLTYVDSVDLMLDSNSTLDLIEAINVSPAEPIREWRRFDGLEAVHAVHEWALRHEESLPAPFHHVVVITKLDLLSQKNNDSSTQGMAYVRSICRGAESASVVEDIGGLATSAIAAHELVHSLGAFHDGSNGGTGEAGNCSARDGYLMAPSSPSGNDLTKSLAKSFQLSECSRSEVEQFLNSTDAECLWAKTTEANCSKLSGGGGESKKLGEHFSLTRQCQIAFGSGKYAHCRENSGSNGRRYFYVPPGADPCRRLWCKNRALGRYAPCETKAFLPLSDGSACGEGRWCVTGSCIAKAAGVMPARSEKRCRDLNQLYCQTLPTFQMRLFCRSDAFSRVCCATCDRLQRERPKAGRMEL